MRSISGEGTRIVPSVSAELGSADPNEASTIPNGLSTSCTAKAMLSLNSVNGTRTSTL